MGFASAEPAPAALARPDEAEVARRADVLALTVQLRWLARSTWLLPTEALWAVLALRAGLPWPWVATALGLRLASHAVSHVQARRLQPLVQQDPARGLQRVRWLYWAFSVWLSLILPTLLIGSDDTTRLLAMLLAAHYAGIVVIAASGDQRLYWGTVTPFLSLMVIGWLLRGGPLGWIMAGMVLLMVPMTVVSLRTQRQGIERLVRLSLEKEQLAASLAIERDRAQAAADARTRFFAAASHDLRQPLHALAINATTLSLLARQADDPRLHDLSQGIGRALVQSQGLLDALLDISRLDAGAVRLQPADVDLAALLRQLHAEFAGQAAEQGLGFGLALPDAPAWACTDVDLLQRVLRNLLDNAFKFTSDGQVGLALDRLPAGAGAAEWRLQVADTGCGIAEADRERVFEEFFQVGNPARDRSREIGRAHV